MVHKTEVMHCPYCQNPVEEESTGCMACGLDLGKLDQVLGIPPALGAGLRDEGQMLKRSDARQVRKVIAQFCHRFPQIRLALVLEETSAVLPLRTWAWWLFNRANFSVALDKGFANRDILLVLDPRRCQAALTIGYGLEPFVGQRDLAAALEVAQSALRARDWGEASIQILKTLDHILETIVGRVPQIYGVPWPSLPMENEHGDPDTEEAAAVW